MKANTNKCNFGYCTLVWMFHDRTPNNRINRIHESALRIMYRDKKSSFTKLLQEDNTMIKHQQSLQALATEFYKGKRGIASDLIKKLLPLSTHTYNLGSSYEFKVENVKTVHHGTESLSFLGPKTWEHVPLKVKSCQILEEFKKKLKSWILENCSCRLCKTYLLQLGFTN